MAWADMTGLAKLVELVNQHPERRARRRPSATVRHVKVEVLYFDGCPSHETLLPHLQELLRAVGASADIERVRLEDPEAAERERFLGSPTLRIDDEDVEPGAERRTDFGLKCRLFATPDGLGGMPADEWVLAAVEQAQRLPR
jgi:hypothetical protein